MSFLSTMNLLSDFSLVQPNPEGDSYSMHPIIRACCRTFVETEDARLKEALQYAVISVGLSIPTQLIDDFEACTSRFAPHIDALADRWDEIVRLRIEALDCNKLDSKEYEIACVILKEKYEDGRWEWIHPFGCIPGFLCTRLEYAKAIDLLERLKNLNDTPVGNRLLRLLTLADLVWCFYRTDQLVGIEEMARSAYTEIETLRGEAALVTLNVQRSVIVALSSVGKYEEALNVNIDVLKK